MVQTVVVIAAGEVELASARFTNDRDGYPLMRAFLAPLDGPDVGGGGAGGAGSTSRSGWLPMETVIDVPAKQAARVRVYSTGNGGKNDPTDARSIAIAALRTPDLSVVAVDDVTVGLRLVSGRRAEPAPTGGVSVPRGARTKSGRNTGLPLNHRGRTPYGDRN